MKKTLPFLSLIVMLTGGPANISGGSDYSKYIQTPEQGVSYQIAHNIHNNSIKDEQIARTRRGIDSLNALIKRIEP